MTVESATYIGSLNASYPASSDQRREGDDHIRLLKSTIKATFPNVAGAVTADHTELSYVDGVTSAIQTQIDSKLATATHTTLAKGQPRLLQTQTASASATIDFKNGTGGAVIDSTYDVYLLEIVKAAPATGAVSMYIRTSTDATNFDASATDYRTDYQQVRSGTATAGGATAAQISMVGGQTLATTSWLNARIWLYKPSAADRCAIMGEAVFYDNASVFTVVRFGGMRDTAADVDAVRFLMSSGNIASGTFNLYGIVK